MNLPNCSVDWFHTHWMRRVRVEERYGNIKRRWFDLSWLFESEIYCEKTSQNAKTRGIEGELWEVNNNMSLNWINLVQNIRGALESTRATNVINVLVENKIRSRLPVRSLEVRSPTFYPANELELRSTALDVIVTIPLSSTFPPCFRWRYGLIPSIDLPVRSALEKKPVSAILSGNSTSLSGFDGAGRARRGVVPVCSCSFACWNI
jgi:hypothetical protein